MISYTVRVEFTGASSTLAPAWIDWMKSEHVGQVLRAGAASAEVVQLDDMPHPVWEARYRFHSRSALQHYLTEHAPGLRAEGIRRFPPEMGVRYSRTTGEILLDVQTESADPARIDGGLPVD